MKRFLTFTIIVFTILSAQAQLIKRSKSDIDLNNLGTITLVNGKVTFEETIPADGYTAEEVENIINAWTKERFAKPKVISAKRFNSEVPGTIILKSEEYITFKSTAFVLERARIYYFLTLTANDGSCTFNMSRITYWYDDEDDKGGLKMKAEEWITDENAINKKGKLKSFEGKFRRRTIELKEALTKELEERLGKK
jgi:hypothetical protein